eukprot:13203172-Alexandrium_andersonii.AAC.1
MCIRDRAVARDGQAALVAAGALKVLAIVGAQDREVRHRACSVLTGVAPAQGVVARLQPCHRA